MTPTNIPFPGSYPASPASLDPLLVRQTDCADPFPARVGNDTAASALQVQVRENPPATNSGNWRHQADLTPAPSLRTLLNHSCMPHPLLHALSPHRPASWGRRIPCRAYSPTGKAASAGLDTQLTSNDRQPLALEQW
jgi:hypothetical protein